MTVDEEVLRLAAGQHALVGTWQVRALGGDHRWVARRVAQGRWERLTRRVLRVVGSAPTDEQRLLAAVLDGGPTAVASHGAAAWLWRLPGFPLALEVQRVRDRSAPPLRAAAHRPVLRPDHHLHVVRSIPCTTLPRTIFDLAAQLPLGRTARVVDAVVTRSPAMLPALHRMLDELACRGRPGITVMRTLLEERPVGSAVAASGLEHRFEQLARNAGVHGLERQVDVGGDSWLGRVDYVQRRLRLLVEVDSRLHHSSVLDLAADATRDEAMLAAGWRLVLRIAEEDIWRAPWLVVELLRGTVRQLEAFSA